MAAIIRDEFRLNSLTQFLSSINTNSIYMAIGRPQSWDVTSSLDTTVPIPTNSIESVTDDWTDITSMKRILSTDVSQGIFKEKWQAGVIYDKYMHNWNGTRTASYTGINPHQLTPDTLSEVKFYVVNSVGKIYICLKQGKNGSLPVPSLYDPSTGTPIGTNTTILKTADGYYWKFIASTMPTPLVNFSSKYYHPVVTALTADDNIDQYTAQEHSKAFKSGIYSIEVIENGSGYNGGLTGTIYVTDAESDARFKVIGNGIGLQYTVVYGSLGSIDEVIVTNPGTGYTHATITAVGGVGAEFEITFTPMSGLGVDPARDLVARYLLINQKFVGDEGGDFSITNEFRKVMLIKNPLQYGSNIIATTTTLDATTSLTVTTTPDWTGIGPDAIITGSVSGAKARIVDYNTSTGILRVIRTPSENSNSLGANNDFSIIPNFVDVLTCTPGTGSTPLLGITLPEVQKHTGYVMYSEYRAPIARGELQTEDIKLVLKF